MSDQLRALRWPLILLMVSWWIVFNIIAAATRIHWIIAVAYGPPILLLVFLTLNDIVAERCRKPYRRDR